MDIYVRPWKAAITEGGLRGLMVTHPEVSGLPMREGGSVCAPVLALCRIKCLQMATAPFCLAFSAEYSAVKSYFSLLMQETSRCVLLRL